MRVGADNFLNFSLTVWRSYLNVRGPAGEAVTAAAKSMGLDRKECLQNMMDVASELRKISKSDSFFYSVVDQGLAETEIDENDLVSMANMYSSISMAIETKAFHIHSAMELLGKLDVLVQFFTEVSTVEDGAVQEKLCSFLKVKAPTGSKSPAFKSVGRSTTDVSAVRSRLNAVMRSTSLEMAKLLVTSITPYLSDYICNKVDGVEPDDVEKAVKSFLDDWGIGNV